MEGKTSGGRTSGITANMPYLIGVTGDAYKIRRDEITGYVTNPAFELCLDAWWFWSEHGVLPYTGGWYEQPKVVKDVIQLFSGCHKAYDAYKQRMRPTLPQRGKKGR